VSAPKICPGVRKLVAGLNAAGWPTCDSGDGSHHAAGMGCARPYPHVTIRIPAYRTLSLVDECEGVASWLLKRGIPVGPIGTSAPSIQGTYDPGNGLAIIDVMHVDDTMLRGGGVMGNSPKISDSSNPAKSLGKSNYPEIPEGCR